MEVQSILVQYLFELPPKLPEEYQPALVFKTCISVASSAEVLGLVLFSALNLPY